MLRVIELNDVEVTLADDGIVGAVSPGFALLEDSGPVLGAAARAAARLKPLRINHRFWSDLTTRPLPRPVPGAASNADLAYLHLRQLLAGRPETGDCVLLVPASLSLEELGLLRAIAQAAGLGRPRIVDVAVAATRAVPASGKIVYVDVELERATLTELRGGASIERGRTLVIPGAGQLAFMQRWLEFIARAMVAGTRFDPLRQGATEQALFDALPGLLRAASTSGRASVALGEGDDRHGIEVTREQLAGTVAPLIDEIVTHLHRLRWAGESSAIALGAHAAALPGLAARLAGLPDTECYALEATSAIAAISGAFALAEGGTAERIVTLASLPGDARKALGATAVADDVARPVTAPSHLLYRGEAIALGGEPLTIGTAVTAARRALNVSGETAGVSRSHCTLLRQGSDLVVFDHSSYGTWLNDERVAHRARLKAGDRLRLGAPGIVLEFIAVAGA